MSQRQSNFELLRIIAMLFVVLGHANYFSLGGLTQHELCEAPIASFWRTFAEQVCIVGVNVFVLISGWFGIKASVKGVCSFFFQVFFYCLSIPLIGMILGLSIPMKDCFWALFFGQKYWFIKAYIFLYLLSPVLNHFVDSVKKTELRNVLIGLFLLNLLYGWTQQESIFLVGYSVPSFIVLYLLARYIRIYGESLQNKSSLLFVSLFFLSSVIPTIISFLGVKYDTFQLHPLWYTSPFVIVASLSLILLFNKFVITSKVI